MQLPQSDIGSVANCEKTSKASPPRFVTSQRWKERRLCFCFPLPLFSFSLVRKYTFFLLILFLHCTLSWFSLFSLSLFASLFILTPTLQRSFWLHTILVQFYPPPLAIPFSYFSLFQCWIGVFGVLLLLLLVVVCSPLSSFANVVHNSCLYALCGRMVPALAWQEWKKWAGTLSFFP